MNESMTRRVFLRTLTVLSASAFLSPVMGAPIRFVPIGKLGMFKLGTIHTVRLSDGQIVCVERLGGTTQAPKLRVLSALCTHKGCVVAWNAVANAFHCPCHGGKFARNGANIAGPPPSPLASLPVKVAHGVVFVSVRLPGQANG